MSPNKKYEEITIKSNVEKQKYKITASQCKKSRILIKNIFERNITVLSKQKYDDVRIEYVDIINNSEIQNSDDAIDYVWNVYNIQKVPDRKCKEI